MKLSNSCIISSMKKPSSSSRFSFSWMLVIQMVLVFMAAVPTSTADNSTRIRGPSSPVVTSVPSVAGTDNSTRIRGPSSTHGTAVPSAGDNSTRIRGPSSTRVTVVPSVAGSVNSAQIRGPRSSPAAPSPSGSGPGFLLRQLDLLDELRLGTDLKEAIRHQRQIKFKSSYGALPVALRLATEQRNSDGSGKSLDASDSDEVQVILDDSSSSSRESIALKDLPPSSEIYFTPEVESSKGSRRKSFDQSNQALLSQNNPFRFRTKQQNRKSNSFSFKKQGRLVMKKMVGKKLLRSGPPKPQKIEQTPIKFQVSSTENVENKVKSQHQSSRGEHFHPSGTRTNGGPNHEENFTNPFYVETPPNAVSSYSFVPENSKVKSTRQGKSFDHQHQSATPKPSRLSHTKPVHTFQPQNRHRPHSTKQRLQVKKVHASPQKSKPLKPSPTTRKRPVTRRIIQKKIIPSRKQSQEGVQDWDHFLGAQPRTLEPSSLNRRHHAPPVKKEKHNKRPITTSASTPVGKPKSLSTLRRGKSFSDNLLPMLEKLSSTKSGYPNLVRVPKTNFRCGSHSGGEYFADVETNCQVFHVCFGGRQASFVCPVGTVFSQQLLVCDWWHKVQCDGQTSRPQRSVKYSDHLWHPLNALAGLGPKSVEGTSLISENNTDGTTTKTAGPNLTTDSPNVESVQIQNSSPVPLETVDEGLTNHFLNSTTELKGLVVSTRNETLVNKNETRCVVDKDGSSQETESNE